MSNILCICHTYAQLIMAIQLKNTLKRSDSVYVCLSDHSSKMDEVAKRIKKLHFFDGVAYWPCLKLDKGEYPLSQKLRDIPKIISGNPTFTNHAMDSVVFDEFIYFNLTVSSSILHAYCWKKNNSLTVSRYEEGILSYDSSNNDHLTGHGLRIKLAAYCRQIAGKTNITDNISGFYCYHPSFYKGTLQAIRVPFITDSVCKEVLSKAFLLDTGSLHYPAKYIFFASVGDFEGENPVGELDIALKIAQLVGQENLLVKVHPRDRTGAFEKAGLTVDNRSAVPWEAIQLNYDFSNYVFLTVVSSSVLGVSMMVQKRPRIHFLYKLCNVEQNSIVNRSIPVMQRLLAANNGLDISNICVPTKLEQIL